MKTVDAVTLFVLIVFKERKQWIAEFRSRFAKSFNKKLQKKKKKYKMLRQFLIIILLKNKSNIKT